MVAADFRDRFCVALIAVSVLGCSIATWAASPCTPAEEKQLKDVRDSWVSNWNAKNLDGVMKLYADDATYTPSDGTPITGKDKIRAYFEKQLGSEVSVESKALDCSGDTAHDNGTFKEDEKGDGTTVSPKTTVLPNNAALAGKGKHVEGEYKVVLKHKKSGGAAMGSGTGMGKGMAVGGADDKWLIVEQASTDKP